MLITFCPYEGTLGIRREKLLKLVKDAGFDGVEIQLGVSYGHMMLDDYDPQDWEDLKSGVEEIGLITPTVMTPPHWPLTHPDYTDLAQRQIRHYLKVANFFEAGVLGIWPTSAEGIPKEKGLKTMRENLSATAIDAKRLGITIVIEFDPKYGGILTNYKEAMNFVKGTSLRILCDTHHVYNCGDDPYKVVTDLGDLIAMVHFSDSGDHLPPGKGKFNFKDFYRALKEIKYEGSVDVVFSCKDINEIKKSREFIRRLEKEEKK